jgi:hypothetical protein
MHMAAASVGLDEARLPQDPQVLGDGPLCNVQPGHDGPDAQGAPFQEAQDPDSGPHGNCLKPASQALHCIAHG